MHPQWLWSVGNRLSLMANPHLLQSREHSPRQLLEHTWSLTKRYLSGPALRLPSVLNVGRFMLLVVEFIWSQCMCCSSIPVLTVSNCAWYSTVTNPDFAPTADTSSTTSQSTASSSSSNKVAILVPAILGSLLVVLLAVTVSLTHYEDRSSEFMYWDKLEGLYMALEKAPKAGLPHFPCLAMATKAC